jgi:transposase
LATDQKKVDGTPGYTLLTVDEAGFYLLPSVVRTYAPCGQTPVLSHANLHPHVSAIAAITPQGKLYTHLQETAIHGQDIVHFLCHLLRQIPGKLVLVWDRAKIHVGDAVKAFLRQGGARDVQLHHFPAYAPELNPTEGIWNYLKNVELPNRCCPDLTDLKRHLRQAIQRVRQKTHIIKACFKHAQLIL